MAGFDCSGSVPCGDDGTVMTRYGVDGDENLGSGCVEPGEPAAAAAPVITPGMVLAAFRRMPLPASELVVQPPGGETLVNFDTIFSTSVESQTSSVSLLGQRLELEARATSFRWVHGDGSEQVSDWAGMEFSESVSMERYISHRYEEAHVTVGPSVDTTWSGRFRLNGGPWMPVPGTVVIEGDPSSLRVVEGQPNLVG